MYIDNMVIKNKTVDSHLADLVEKFQVLNKFNMHLIHPSML